jgi:hypothetical protein
MSHADTMSIAHRLDELIKQTKRIADALENAQRPKS